MTQLRTRTNKVKRVAFTPDLQAPFVNEAAVRVFGKFLRKWQPHQNICIGDEIDLPYLGSFSRGSIDEFKGNIDDDRKYTQDILEYLGVTDVLGSNHGIRLYRSIKKQLPSLLNLPELHYERFMQYDKLGIKFHPYGLNWAHGWTAIHGDSVPLSNLAGQSALGAAKRMGVSVVMGHTHRLGLSCHTEAFNGRVGRVLYGCEVGNMVDLSSSGMRYTKGYANWQTGFAVAYVQGRKVQVIPVPVAQDGSFIFEGKLYQ